MNTQQAAERGSEGYGLIASLSRLFAVPAALTAW